MLNLKNMTAEEFKKLSKEEQELELKRCESFEYFYNNYCRKEGMPEYSEKEWKAYVEKNNKKRFSRRRVSESNRYYPFTIEEAFKL